MNRSKLFEEPIIDNHRVKQLDLLLEDIETKLSQDIDVDTEIKEFHKIAKKIDVYTKNDFETYWKAISKEEFINDILVPTPPKIENMTKEEILFVLNKMGTSDFATYYLQLLKENITYDNSLSDLIFWPNELGYDSNLDCAEMAEIILHNKKSPNSK